MAKKYKIGLFDNEKSLLEALKSLKDKNVKVHDVFLPYPVHGVDDAIGLKPSRLPIIAFAVGFCGVCFALFFQRFTFIDWPNIIGGKPAFALPAFIPVTFEIMVLSGALSMVAAFLYRSKLFPTPEVFVFDERATNDRFVVAIDLEKSPMNSGELDGHLREKGAVEVNEKEV